MVWRILLSAFLVSVSVIGAGLALVACGSTNLGAKGNVRGISGEVTVSTEGKKQWTVSGSLPPGVCLEVAFIDETGKVIGTASVAVPGYVDIPDGSVGQNLRFFDCRELAGAPSPLAGGPLYSAGTHTAAPTQWHEMSYWALEPNVMSFDPWSNTIASARIRLPLGADPHEAMLALVGSGLGSPLGPDVEVQLLAQVIPTSGGALLRVSDNEPIVDFAMTWNGVLDYADLNGSNVKQVVLDHGWRMVQVAIPLADFDLSPQSWNGGEVTVLSASASTSFTSSAYYQVP